MECIARLLCESLTFKNVNNLDSIHLLCSSFNDIYCKLYVKNIYLFHFTERYQGNRV